MKIIIITLLLLFTVYANFLNEFSGDVDYYDLGVMERGKNAGSWHHSLENNFDIFLLHVHATLETFYYSIGPGTTGWATNEDQDFCQNQYAYPIEEFAIDWASATTSEEKIESTTINGITCYVYPAKSPLTTIYLTNKFTSAFSDTDSSDICRMDFIGGRSITFRSFNSVDMTFYESYNSNTTSKCTVAVHANDVDTSLAIVYAIADTSAVKNVQNYMYYFQITKKLSVPLSELNYATLSGIEVQSGAADLLINAAKTDLSKKVDNGIIARGTIIALMDKQLSNDYDASVFDRLDISVHSVIFNINNNDVLAYRALSLVSLGAHYHEATSASAVQTKVIEAFKAVRTNLTDRCPRSSCDGFCDAMNRCTCPMCCENDCYYTFCDVETASCVPWPKDSPKKKVECSADCIGSYECIDQQGCVLSQVNTSCEAAAACMTVYCDGDSLDSKCLQKDSCTQDTTPSSDGYCYNYECDQDTGYCTKITSSRGSACPTKSSLCEEYACDADLNCYIKDKECVKTSPYIEYDCYEAKCNEQTGMCENKLTCDTYTSCGGTSTETVCKCDSSTNYVCSCEKTEDGEYCDSDLSQVCDYTQETPQCVVTNCPLDLITQNCQVRRCDEDTSTNYWVDINCTVNSDEVSENCIDITYAYCSDNECVYALNNNGVNGCYTCVVNDDNTVTETGCSTSGLSTGISVECVDGECVYNDDTPCEEILDLDCPSYYTYSFDSTTGECSYTIDDYKSDCKLCNPSSANFESYCSDKSLQKTLTVSTLTEDYEIDRVCVVGGCIPNPSYDCTQLTTYENIVNNCGAAFVSAKYSYSSLYDAAKANLGYNQTSDFFAEMDEMAYCVITVSDSAIECGKCVLNGESYLYKNQCPEIDGVEVTCEDNQCVIVANECPTEECVIQFFNESSTQCEPYLDNCAEPTETLTNAREGLTDYTSCGDVVCNTNAGTCGIVQDDSACYRETGIDYGCTVPYYESEGAEVCITSDNSYICKYKELTLDDEEESYLEGIEVDNKCKTYECVEETTDGVISHHWELTSEVTAEARNLCETAECDTTTGEVVYTDVVCRLADEFPTLSANQALCFYCACSYQDGSSVLQMYSDTEDEIYTLDACGNCIVSNRTTGEQTNEERECVLTGEINNAGAIAAATTVAVVVVVLVVSFTFFAFGAFNTYRLVSSAMKNEISATIDNPTHVAADTNAENPIFNG
ncbi:170 kDa surface lectin [Entamoeba marina]